MNFLLATFLNYFFSARIRWTWDTHAQGALFLEDTDDEALIHSLMLCFLRYYLLMMDTIF